MSTMNNPSSYKAFFLGPKSENEAWVRAEFQAILGHWFRWRKELFQADEPVISKEERCSPAFLASREKLAQGLEELNRLLASEIPKFTPRYVGHMVSELALPALMGHFAMLLHNPNNTSRDSSKVGSHIEEEVIRMLAEMLGFDPDDATGHVTGGGTVANFEAVWRARFRQDHWLSLMLYLAEERGVKLDLFEGAHMGWTRFNQLLEEQEVPLEKLRNYSAIAANPYDFGVRMNKAFGISYRGPVILVPENKHFSWAKAVNIFGFGEDAFWPVPLDSLGKMDVPALRILIDQAEAEQRPITMVVSVAGTTEAGEIDPIDQVQDVLNTAKIQRGFDIWHHIDAAYGGFLCSMLHGNRPNVLSVSNTAALTAIAEAHSVTIDPHKLGYVPYACGAIITRDAQAYAVSSFKAPYLEGQLSVPDKWSTTLEGSRSAAGAAATWLTGKTLGFDGDGLGRVLADTILACRRFRAGLLLTVPFVRALGSIDTNILCFSLARDKMSLSASNRLTEATFARFSKADNFSLSKTTLTLKSHGKVITAHVRSYDGEVDDDQLVLLRCVFMNPFWAVEPTATSLLAEFSDMLKAQITEFTKG